MTIRNIITASAMVAVLGLAGGSAYADGDVPADQYDQGFTVPADANYPGTVFIYNGDSDVNEGDQTTFGLELSVLPKHLWCTKWSNSGTCWVRPSS